MAWIGALSTKWSQLKSLHLLHRELVQFELLFSLSSMRIVKTPFKYLASGDKSSNLLRNKHFLSFQLVPV